TELTEKERAEAAAQHTAWLAERKRQADDLIERGKRSYAAMQGWGAVETEEQWFAIQDQAAEDWASGAALIRMLGGERYLDPPRMALLLHLWHHFVIAYRPEGPAEYLCIAMALVGFNQLIRVNEFVGNLAGRAEFQVFSAERPLDVRLIERDGRSRAAGRYDYVEGEEAVARLGRDALPLLDRLNRMVLRNLKALRDLKAAPITLNVTNLGQMNVGQAQTNVTQPMVAKDTGAIHAKPSDASRGNTGEL
ncbi:MAG: hypothetical protein M3Q65_18515, partial [Chloroflexota bacterium]|nr:hypothetical protein [Chloroflexota bacterium]